MRTLKRAGLAFAGLLALIGLALGFIASTAFPKRDGSISVAGLARGVDIYRDAAAVPYIYAQSQADAYLALGFVHAQDRFWQMELMRRFGAGRLSEILGPATVASDKWMRTLGLYPLAEAQAGTLPAPVQAALAAYARGVNQWLTTKTGLGAIELAAFRYQPEPWKPADSLIWSKIMATRLAGNFRKEIARSQVAARLGVLRANQFWPDYPVQAPTTAGDSGAYYPGDLFARIEAFLPSPAGLPGGASNQWVVGPDKSATGAPLLANDPHLGFSAPVLWYLAHIEAPGLQMTGATVPGVPFHILGHNGQIAWGITSTQADQEDLVIEQIAADATTYATVNGPKAFARRSETIAIKGQADQTLEVRATVHGPVLSDLPMNLPAGAETGQIVALNAVYLKAEDQTLGGLYLLNRATDWAAFRHALAFVNSPALNLSYADTSGNIGFQVAGNLPVRRSGDGSLPVPGWTAAGDWSGRVPFAQLPSLYNPARGLIVNANNPVGDPTQAPFISRDWAAPYRALRIEQQLQVAKNQSAGDMQALQLDEISLMAHELLPAMAALVAPQTDRDRAAVAMLAGWDGRMARDRPQPLLFSQWLRALNRALYGDDLGDLSPGLLGLRPRFVLNSLNSHHHWCNNINTAEIETCADVVTASLTQAVADLSKRYGADMTAWRWGDAHPSTFTHGVFNRVPVLNRLANLSIASGGGDFTVNRGASRVNDDTAPFRHIHGPGYRAVYDLSDLTKSRYAIATGQSGNFLSGHYRDQLVNWRDGIYLEINGTRALVESQSDARLRLLPAAP
ncbi:MAG: penicillin acylase family protein [Rhodospirillales bacterium]|nr:penicillin acylase family protein [Rhodospirillales bacterium]